MHSHSHQTKKDHCECTIDLQWNAPSGNKKELNRQILIQLNAVRELQLAKTPQDTRLATH